MNRLRKFGPNAFKPKMKGGMPRMKKFEEGGSVDDDKRSPGMTDFASSGSSAGKSQSFSEAFREARKAGLKTFKWQGGSYGTKLKGEDGGKETKPAASAPSRPSAPAAAAPSRPAPAAASTARSRSGYTRTARPQAKQDADYTAARRASYGERVLSPFINTFGGDTFGLRREEGVMNRMGVDRSEARKRLAKLDEVEGRGGKAAGITESEKENAKTAATVGSLALGGAGGAGLAALRGGATAARAAAPAVARAATRSATRRGVGSGRVAAERRKTEEQYRNFAENKGMGSGRGAGRQYATGGSVKTFAKGGSVRGGGCETKGKTRGRFV